MSQNLLYKYYRLLLFFFFIINKYLLKKLFNFKKYERAKKKTFSYELNDFQLMKSNAFVITTETNNYKL